jgi:hypothetical protein
LFPELFPGSRRGAQVTVVLHRIRQTTMVMWVAMVIAAFAVISLQAVMSADWDEDLITVGVWLLALALIPWAMHILTFIAELVAMLLTHFANRRTSEFDEG